MKLVVAVSGGVDSVVLLDMLARTSDNELIVAHFDHGIRPDSADDAYFVAGLAKQYGLLFETRREELGGAASEGRARQRRYAFLFAVAKKHQAQLTTAHHADDVIETIALNLTRGTEWRGLAGLSNPRIYRPLVGIYKSELITYAKAHHLLWHEDSTNRSETYLRNRLRHTLSKLDQDSRQQLLALWARQRQLTQEVLQEERNLLKVKDKYSRYFFTQIDSVSALELLRALTHAQLTYPQLDRLLIAIKTQRADKTYQAGAGVLVHFTSRHFCFEMVN